MIQNEKEYWETVDRVQKAKAHLLVREPELLERGFSAEEVKRLLDPVRSFFLQMEEEAEAYRKLMTRQRQTEE